MSRFTMMLAAAALVASGTARSADALEWKQHDIQFHYMGFTSIYSCDGLVDQLKVLLAKSGAGKDAKVRSAGCTEPMGPDRMAGARLTFSTVAGDPKGEAPAGAVWRKVKFANTALHSMQSGDCELMEQYRDEVIKKAFTTRNLKSRTTCFPHQANQHFDIEFEVLVPAN
ncbi:MAG: hypothetical protein RLZZ200_266 [Pseudomonadota bacterium]|jgi:hypothetical protein